LSASGESAVVDALDGTKVIPVGALFSSRARGVAALNTSHLVMHSQSLKLGGAGNNGDNAVLVCKVGDKTVCTGQSCLRRQANDTWKVTKNFEHGQCVRDPHVDANHLRFIESIRTAARTGDHAQIKSAASNLNIKLSPSQISRLKSSVEKEDETDFPAQVSLLPALAEEIVRVNRGGEVRLVTTFVDGDHQGETRRRRFTFVDGAVSRDDSHKDREPFGQQLLVSFIVIAPHAERIINSSVPVSVFDFCHLKNADLVRRLSKIQLVRRIDKKLIVVAFGFFEKETVESWSEFLGTFRLLLALTC
jgi:uncharacterized membrane protein